MISLSFSSEVAAPAEALWQHTAAKKTLNREFSPWLRMTAPGPDILPASIEAPQKLFRSYILLFGFLPVEYDDLAIEEFEPPHPCEASITQLYRVFSAGLSADRTRQSSRICDRERY